MTNQVVESAETLVLAPGESGPLICTPENLPAGDSASGVALVPLQSRGEVLGLVCIRATEPDYTFTPVSTALAQTLGGTLANAIENSRLVAEAQAEAAEEERKRLARELHELGEPGALRGQFDG